MKNFKLIVLTALVLIIGLPLAAQDFSAGGPIESMSIGASQITWQPQAGKGWVTVTVTGPGDYSFTAEFPPGKLPIFSALDDEGKPLPDGSYNYEIGERPKNTRTRAENDPQGLPGKSVGKGPVYQTQSGTFTVAGGSIVDPGLPEGSSAKQSGATTEAIGPEVGTQQTISGDLSVYNSLCVGFDCLAAESYGSDTVRLKENNLRIHFEDTSTGSFPSTDWRLTANDSASGGANRFSIEDVTASRVPFTVEGNSRSHSLYVDSGGRVGFGTSTPVVELHTKDGDSPALRLEQDASAGFAPQAWDLAGNETSFFIRDVTNGSTLPFRVFPGSPSNSLVIKNGDVGLGTTSPDEDLHIKKSVNGAIIAEVENTNAGSSAVSVIRTSSDTAGFNMSSHAGARTLSRFGQTLGGWTEILTFTGNGMAIGTSGPLPMILGTNSVNRIEIGANGGVTVTGDFTVSGGTKNFAVIDPTNSANAIYYAALEGPEAGTYVRGTAKTVDGVAVIELPRYFSSITEQERMTVQLTPFGGWGQVYVAERSPERIVVKLAPGSSEELEFDYFVQGIRLGYLDFEVERKNDLPPLN